MINLERLSFEYKLGKKLFNNLSLQFTPGNIYGLLGKNGAGKTTLLKLMCGLLFPWQGSCAINGFPAVSRHPHFLKDVFFISEEFYLPPLSVDMYLKIYAPFYPCFLQEKFYEYAREFELDLKAVLTAFSYGQKKKFLLAFGLATACAYFLLDEPTNGLDIPSKRQFRRLLAASLEPERMFIISTHQVRDLENIIDPIIILDEGEILFARTLEEIAKCLTVSIQPMVPQEDSTVLYYEKTMGGYAILKENKSQAESQVDIELLFNAVVSHKQQIKQIFSQEVKHA